MSSFPRRSARLAPHLTQDQQQRSLSSQSIPSFSQPSSTSTTSHPSPTNNALHPPPPPPTPQQPRLNVPSQFMPQQSHLNAPLPSPSANEMTPFFGRSHSQPNAYASQPTSNSAPQEQQTFGQQDQGQTHQLHPHTNSISGSHPQGMAGMNSSQMPPDFLAEAAKRAQIACLMRDLNDVAI